jgi:hypothetical protein
LLRRRRDQRREGRGPKVRQAYGTDGEACANNWAVSSSSESDSDVSSPRSQKVAAVEEEAKVL